LNVAQPLHVSLSRPLALKTDQKATFLAKLQDAIFEGKIKAFDVHAKEFAWHPNESKTRWFLVLRLEASTNLSKLLDLCNGTAKAFGQPLLYDCATRDSFHISIAWSLQPLKSREDDGKVEAPTDTAGIPYALLGRLDSLSVQFDGVKIRVGQDVHNIALKAARRQSSG
jgi:U6 snRNA phosphodiesterase